MVTIKKAAELTGVPEHTLRAWERRYRLVEPSRSPAGYRVYDQQALERITVMHQLVTTGWRPREAAAEATRRTGFVGDAETATNELIAAAVAMDADAIGRILDAQLDRVSFELAVDGWLMPTLVRVGQAWSHGELSVAGEHLVSSIVMGRLAAIYEASPRVASGPVVVIGAPPGVDHELGLLAFAAAARRSGLNTVWLGAQVPAQAWRDAVDATGAAAVVTALHRRTDASRLEAIAAAVADHRGLELWVGGRHQQLAPAPMRGLGHSIAEAPGRLWTALGAQGQSASKTSSTSRSR